MAADPYPRKLTFSATYNFRDVGGYPGLDGRQTRWQRLYRADALHRLEGPDWDTFEALGVRTVIDLRRDFEIAKYGRVPEHHSIDYRNVPLRHVDWAEVPHPEGVVHERWLADRYLNFIDDGREQLAEALGIIADADRAPVVVHCMAGKDRTGVTTALALALCGVPDEVIAADYALTTAAMRTLTDYLLEHHPSAVLGQEHMFDSPPEAMTMFLTDLRALHGSVAGYVASIGVTDAQVAALRGHLLEPV